MDSLLFERIAREAAGAFSRGISDPYFSDSFHNLVRYVGKLRASDVKLNESLNASPDIAQSSACLYIDVFTCDKFAISISILNPGVNFPLHDTPGMHGIVKVIKGSVKITTYTTAADGNANIAVPKDVRALVNGSQGNNGVFIPVYKQEPMRLDENNKPCILRPQQGNFHEICGIDYQAAFIKILAPPYDMVNRTYTFYKALQTAEEDAEVKTWLVKSPPDSTFFISTLPYLGPQI